MMENAGKSSVSTSSRGEEDAKAKKPKMRLERKRTREEELKALSDLSIFENLAAMLEAEKFRKKKKRRRKKKKKNVEVEAQEDGAVNVAEEEEPVDSVEDVESNNSLVSDNAVPQKPLVDAAYEDKANTVIAADTADSFETERVEISEKYVLEKDLSFTKDEERGLQKAKRQCKKNEEVMSSLDEFKMLSDLSNFKNLAAMMEAEAFMRRKKIKRRKKKRKIESGAQDEITVDVGRGQEQPDRVKAVTTTKALETGPVSVSENILPENLFVDEVKAGVQPDTIKAADMRKASETESVSVTKNIVSEKLFVSNFKIDEESISQEAKEKCTKNEEVMSSLDEFKMLSDLSNFKNLAAMIEAEAFMRCKKRKKRRKKKGNIEFEAPFQINILDNHFSSSNSHLKLVARKILSLVFLDQRLL